MNAIELKRTEFRHYLEKSGVMDALSRALIKLYDEPTKPDDPVAFVRQNFLGPDDDVGSVANKKTLEIKAIEENGNGKCPDALIKSLREELSMARREIVVLQKALDGMEETTDRPARAASPSEGTAVAAITAETPVSNPDTIDLPPTAGDENSFDQLLSDLLNSGDSLLQKHLTKELYTSSVDIKTETFESTLLDCIKAYSRNNVGLAAIGLFATDADCYSKFSGLFSPIIEEYHGACGDTAQAACDWGDATQLGFLDPNGVTIEWIKIVSRRSIDGHLFTPRMNEHNLVEMLEMIKGAANIDEKEDLEFFNVSDLLENDIWKNDLHLELSDYEQQSFWPLGRGLLVNKDRSCATLICFEDHLTFVSLQCDGNFAEAYQRHIDDLKSMEGALQFTRHPRLGWLTVCPSNLGAAVRISVALKLTNTARLTEICALYGLSADVDNSMTIVSNRSSFGCTEYECIKRVHDGIAELVSEQGKTPDALEPDSPADIVTELEQEEPNEIETNEPQSPSNKLNEPNEISPNHDEDGGTLPDSETDADKIDDSSYVIRTDTEGDNNEEKGEGDDNVASVGSAEAGVDGDTKAEGDVNADDNEEQADKELVAEDTTNTDADHNANETNEPTIDTEAEEAKEE